MREGGGNCEEGRGRARRKRDPFKFTDSKKWIMSFGVISLLYLIYRKKGGEGEKMESREGVTRYDLPIL